MSKLGIVLLALTLYSGDSVAREFFALNVSSIFN